MQRELQETVEKTFENVIGQIDAKYLRKTQADMHRCALSCFERPNGSPRSDQDCANQCSRPISRAQSIFNHCLEEYNRTLTTCMEACVDSVRYSKELTTQDEEKVMKCTKSCVDAFVSKQNSVIAKTLGMLNDSK